MHILGTECVQKFVGKIINIHPALLPKFRGLHTHQRVIDANETEHGSTVHLVNAELDAGQIIAQARLAITPTDTVNTLEEKIKCLEHQLYPEVIQLFATERLQFDGTSLRFDQQPLPQNGLQLKVLI
jgi:phosphoribosylglycinamide formyltransferase 1